jgi:hypothetical protein
MRTFLTRTNRNHTGSFTTSCHFAQDFIGNSLMFQDSYGFRLLVSVTSFDPKPKSIHHSLMFSIN